MLLSSAMHHHNQKNASPRVAKKDKTLASVSVCYLAIKQIKSDIDISDVMFPNLETKYSFKI
jgi:hypothetical protein